MRSQFNFFYFLHKTIFFLYNWLITFSCCHLTAIKTLLNCNTKLADNAKIPTPSIVHALRHTTRNTKTSTLTVTLLNKIERIRKIVTAITVVPKKARVSFGFNCWQSSLPSSEEIFITGNSLCSLLSHWLAATQILRLSNLIHILLFKLFSILPVYSWHSYIYL